MSAPRRRHKHYVEPRGRIAQMDIPLLSADPGYLPSIQPVYRWQDVDVPTYSGDLDGERLTSQLDAVLALMSDQQWRTLSEIRAAIGRGSEAGISARLREIRNSRRGVVERRRRGDPKNGLHEYRLVSLCR